MRIYINLEECFRETERDLKEMGIIYVSETVQDKVKKVNTIELNNYGYTLIDPDYREVLGVAGKQGINLVWLRAEASERGYFSLKQKNPNPAYRKNLKFWKPFLRDGCFSYTYPERLHPQIDRVIHELKIRPNTRQAVLTLYDWHQDIMNLGGRDRIPCSMYYQFLIRKGKLHCSYTMRSCDLYKFFLSDVALAIYLMTKIAECVNRPIGNFTHFIGSLHAFESELEGVF